MKKIIIVLIACFISIGSIAAAYAFVTPEMDITEQIKIKKRCNTCNGTGKVTRQVTHGPCSGKGCAGCDYKGYVVIKVDCSNCGGTGWVQVN